MRKLELLSPAGDLERTQMALAYGADAVYLSGPGYGMRAVGCMNMENLAAAVSLCHEQGAKAYITCNTVCPTARSTAGSMLSIVSSMVCHVGENPVSG